jgi:hypothetical protein
LKDLLDTKKAISDIETVAARDRFRERNIEYKEAEDISSLLSIASGVSEAPRLQISAPRRHPLFRPAGDAVP